MHFFSARRGPSNIIIKRKKKREKRKMKKSIYDVFYLLLVLYGLPSFHLRFNKQKGKGKAISVNNKGIAKYQLTIKQNITELLFQD